MKNPLPDPVQRFDAAPHAALLLEVDELRLRYQASRAAGRVLPNAIEAIRVELTYHSNAIEGNTLSLRDTQLVIEGLEPNSGKSLREIYEARNHDRALRKIESWLVTNPPPAPLTVDDLLNVHAEVLADINPNDAGRFRKDRVLITGTRYVPPGSHKFAELMQRSSMRSMRWSCILPLEAQNFTTTLWLFIHVAMVTDERPDS